MTSHAYDAECDQGRHLPYEPTPDLGDAAYRAECFDATIAAWESSEADQREYAAYRASIDARCPFESDDLTDAAVGPGASFTELGV